MSSSVATPSGFSLEELRAQLEAEGFRHHGIAELETPFSIALYDQWLAEGLHGNMEFLEEHAAEKRDPKRLLDRAHSAIVLTLDYVPHPEPVPLPVHHGVAAYARGRDYHWALHRRLERLVAWMKERAPNEEFRSFTDSNPVLERDLAARAGLGWVGKNTCLIGRERGSMFFIAEIYTTMNFGVAKVEAPRDFCGTCTRCLDACPTGAIIEPRKLDARKCISYWTIEARTPAPVELREKIGTWLFGCDICQTVCPWNQKVFGAQLQRDDDRTSMLSELRFLLTAPHREIDRAIKKTPLKRAGGAGLKRNAIIVAVNMKATELLPEIAALEASEKHGELARWALDQFLKST